VILALIDAKNRFLALDFSSYGKGRDAGIFTKSVSRKSISSGNDEFPASRPLPGMTAVLPHHYKCYGMKL
jgi:hypothetical protein